jgi:hypothetical protein
MPRKSEMSPALKRAARVLSEEATRRPPIKVGNKRIRQAKEYLRYLLK